MSTSYTLKLNDPAATLACVGGKGASLARLAGAGIPVPDGFHITTDAYRHFVEENGLQPRILAALEGVDAARPATLEQAAQAIAAVFADGNLPPDLAALPPVKPGSR